MRLALIAGQGDLPQHLVSVLRARGEVPLLCEDEQLPAAVTDMVPRIGFRLEKLGTLIRVLQEAGITHLCMAGAVRRPHVDPSLLDKETVPLVPRFMQAMAQGDDAILRAFVSLFEDSGMTVIGATDIDPELLPQAGAQGAVTTPQDLEDDLAAAVAALREMGEADLGQAVVVKDGEVLAREEDAGTDDMLNALAPDGKPVSDDPLGAMGEMIDSVADWLSGPEAEAARRTAPAAGGVLYKAPKPGQELRVDMPVIGPDTVLRAAQAGLRGIVIEEGGVMIVNRAEVIERLDAQGLFLWVRPGTGA